MSIEMEDFIDKIDRLCYECGFQIWPTEKGWTGKVDENNNFESIAIISSTGEIQKVIGFDGDGNGK